MGAAFQSVEFRVTRVGEERLGHGYGGGGITKVTKVAREPFVVVRVVVDLVGDEEMLGHVCVVNTGGGLLAKDGIVIALGLGVDVSGHVPHVGDAGGGFSEAGGGIERLLVLAVVPEVDGVVVGGVIGFFGKDLLENGVESEVTADGNTFAVELPAAANEEGLGFDVVGVVQDEVFVSADEIFDALFGVLLLFVIVIGDFGVEIGAFVRGDF